MEDTPHDVGCMLPVFGSAKDVSTQIYQEEGGPEGTRFAFIFRGSIFLHVIVFPACLRVRPPLTSVRLCLRASVRPSQVCVCACVPRTMD